MDLLFLLRKYVRSTMQDLAVAQLIMVQLRTNNSTWRRQDGNLVLHDVKARPNTYSNSSPE